MFPRLPLRQLYSDEDVAHANRMNIEWHLQNYIDRLLDSDIPIDRPLAKILMSVADIIYHYKKIKWWIRDDSSITWIWWNINKLGVKLKLRQPIIYEYEFSKWAPLGHFTFDLDFDDVI